jgi:16S rRNA (adenine1518-N6/adenine1519-N6)-dimethyltransferase
MKKKLGQNFLIDKKVAEREVEYANISKRDTVLEIGPGNGIITHLLAEKAKKVIAIEIDKKLIEDLQNLISDNVELIHGDALKIDFNMIPKFNKIVSNLPFQISSPITFKLLNFNFSLAILIYQKEFADRMIAVTGSEDYSRLSVSLYYKAKCEVLEKISKTSFKPQPKIDSSLIKLIPRKKPPFDVINEEYFFELTKNLFNHRRKKIKNILKDLYSLSLKDIPYINKRVENLSPEQIAELGNILFKFQYSKN